MPEFGCPSGSAVFANTPVYATTGGIHVDAHASANTKGSAVELIASTPFDANWVSVNIGSPSFDQHHLVDIMVGGSGSEQVIIPDLMVRFRDYNTGFAQYLFPVYVPRGSRVSARCQSGGGGGAVTVQVQLIAGAMLSGASSGGIVSAYGSTTSSIGTSIDPGADDDVKSAWVEIASATTRAHNWLTLSVINIDETLASEVWLIDIGIGASSSEVVLVPDLLTSSGNTTDLPIPQVFQFPIHVPTGSRLSVRAQCSGATAGNRVLHVKLYGA